MKKLTFSVMFLIGVTGYSQNSQQTQNSMSWASYYEGEAQKALSSQDYEKLKYFLKSWEVAGYPNDDFHKLWADYWISKGRTRKAKRELMKAFNQFGCYTCKEEAQTLSPK